MSKQKQLSINLDERKSPHPIVTAAYRDAEAEHLYSVDRPEIIGEERIFAAARASKKPIKHQITSLYQKRSNGKIYVFWNEELITHDFFGNILMHNRQVGRISKPIISKQFGLNPGMIKGNSNINEMMAAQAKEVNIDGHETIYEFTLEAIKPQLLKWKEQNIISDSTTILYVWDGEGPRSKYSMPYTWDQWIGLSFDDLVLLGKFGAKFNGLLDGNQNENTAQILKTLRQTIVKELQTGLTQELKATT